MHSSHIEISKTALANNISFIRTLLKPGVVFSSVLKSNAYGHGIDIMVKLLQELGVNHFSVFNSFEARQVLKAAKEPCSILILGEINTADVDWIIDNEIEFYIFNLTRLQYMLKRARAKQAVINIHIEVETGMNRTGVNRKEWDKLIELINENNTNIKAKGICTHYAGAESISNFIRIKKQQKLFRRAIKYFNKRDIFPEKVHASCSAAMLAFPKQQYDMVRIGILQYGFWPSKESFIGFITKNKMEESPLRRILSWKSYIMDIKKVNKGEYVGYGNTFLAETDMVIASVPVGYGYGYSRSLSNLGRVIVKNQRFGVVGIVNMNMFLIDITAADNVLVNDEVILIGSSEDLEITVSSFSSITEQLNYELLSRLDKDITRTIT